MATVWEEFGIAVAKARAAKKWTLAAVAGVAFNNPDRKGYVSQIEKGRTKLHFSTVRKLATALDLPESVTDPVYRADLPAEDVVAEEDRTAERLMRVSEADGSITLPSEALLISLAYEFARGSHKDLITAYNGLKAALTEAADLKARGMLPQNTSDQVTTLLRRVAELNDQGLREAAATEVDTALADLDASHAAQKSALIEIGIRQDRIRNNPTSAAQRLLTQLRSVAHPGGLFTAIHAAWQEWHDRGYDKGIGFDLQTALHLARANLGRAKSPQRGQALLDLGTTLAHLGEREGHNPWLIAAIRTFRDLLAECPRKRHPLNWALAQASLGNALQTLGTREPGTGRLEQSVAAFRAVPEERTRDRDPLGWAMAQNNLGNVLTNLGEGETGTSLLEQSVTAYRAALEERTRDRVPLNWATSWGNMGEALMVLADRTADLAMARQALQQLQDAQAVLRDGGHLTFANYMADRIPRAAEVIDRLA